MKLVFGTHRRPSSATDSVRSESESLVNGAASQDARPDQVRQTPASRTMLVQPTTCLAPVSVTATAVANLWKELAAELESDQAFLNAMSELEFSPQACEPYEVLPSVLNVRSWAA